MANSITTAKAYISNEEALNAVRKNASYLGVLWKPTKFIGANKVEIKTVSFADNTMGTYDRATGFEQKDMTVSWTEKTLTQDKGNKLFIDRMDAEETGTSIIETHNEYMYTVAFPTIDTYAISAICSTSGVQSITTTADFGDDIIDARALIENQRFNMKDLVLLVSATKYAELSKSTRKNAHVQSGNWNGRLETEAEMFDEILIQRVPASYFPEGVSAVLLHKDAVVPAVKYKKAKVYDDQPGIDGIQEDLRIYFDAFVEPRLEKAVVKFVAPASDEE